MIRRKRFSALGKLPSALSRRGLLPLGSRSMVGGVAAKMLEFALAEPGAVPLEIVISTGPAPERWNPDSLELKSLGRSETLVWELSRHLVALGHRVRVFADCAGLEGVFSEVEWLDRSRFVNLGCDVLLVSGDPVAVQPVHDVRARLNVLWLQDAHCAERLTPAFDSLFDGYLCSSADDVQGFRAHHPAVAANKVLHVEQGSEVEWAALARAVEKIFVTLLYAKRLDIVIFTGPALEPWNPDTVRATGMGGSETMAWELSRHLAALGHRVRVFGHCAGMEGWFDGVEWLDYRRFRGLSCDVLLSSRQPAAVDRIHEVEAKVRLLWVHDVHCGDKLSPERDARIDAYLCLSGWHVACFQQHHPQIGARKMLQIRNGIDLDDYPPESAERDPLRAIYSSCPSRGLKIALDSWPSIRAAVPGATLHVYYGFGNWERRAALDNDRAAATAIAAMKVQIANTEGVVFHGRISPSELARHFRCASVWAYPDWFHETSCITAMQAQAAGLRIVTSSLAALNETVADRGVLLTEDPRSEGYRTAFTAATIAALRFEPTDEERAALRAYAARHFDLPRLASECVAIFRALLRRAAAARG